MTNETREKMREEWRGIHIKTPEIEIIYQPLNKTWGVNMKINTLVINEVGEKLSETLIEALKIYSPQLNDYCNITMEKL